MVAAPGRVLGRWGVLMVVAHTVTAIPTESIVRLDMNRVHPNGEIDRLLANYKSAQESPSDLSSIKRVLLSFMAQASERVWWNDELTTATTESQTKQTFSSLEAVETPIRSGEGSHTINVLVGGQERELIIDTGSGKTAFICDGCTDCGSNHKHEPFRHTNNTKFLACNPINKGNPDLGGCMACVESKCRYGQKYVEGDYWEAYKMTDVLSFNPQGTNLPSLEARIEFGCIYAQTGCFNEQTSDGIMGFSRHPDAIYEQFYRQKATQSRIFAQCLAADGGALTIGGVDMHLNTSPVAYTPLLHTGYQYWTVNLESISIGSTQLAVDRQVLNSERGCVLDSGTTFVYLPTAVKAAFVGAWRQARGGSEDNLPVSDTYHHIPDSSLQELPSICFHFAHDAHLCMKPDAYMYKLSANEYAGTIFFGDEARSTIVGASALMHHNIIYDVDNNRVGMAEANCDASILSSADLATERMIALELHPGGDTFRSPIDHEYWAQVGLAAVALVAVGGLVLTIWEELRRPPTTANTKITMPDPEGIVTPLLGAVGHENEGEDFSFYLMPDDA